MTWRSSGGKAREKKTYHGFKKLPKVFIFSKGSQPHFQTWRRGLPDGRVGRIPIEKQIQSQPRWPALPLCRANATLADQYASLACRSCRPFFLMPWLL